MTTVTIPTGILLLGIAIDTTVIRRRVNQILRAVDPLPRRDKENN